HQPGLVDAILGNFGPEGQLSINSYTTVPPERQYSSCCLFVVCRIVDLRLQLKTSETEMARSLSRCVRCRCVVFTGAVCIQVALATNAHGQTPTIANQVFTRNSPAIVTIEARAASDPTVTFGSGVLIDRSGVVVTNLHVMEGASEASIRLANHEKY